MKQFNVGIVGYGWAAGAHIAAINAGALGQVTAVCSSRKLDAAEVSAKHGCALRTYNDYAAMLADPNIHAVSICTYHRFHKDQIIAAARAGKHIIAEKPLAQDLAGLREVEQAVRAAGVTLCVCLEMRFSEQFRTIKSLINDGKLGKLHYGEVDYFHGIGPWYPGFKWYPTAEDGVSSFMLAGCHAMDALLFCFDGEVDEVFAYSVTSANPVFKPYEYPSTTIAMLKFRDGKIGKAASVLDCFQPYYFHTHLVGSEGTVLDDKFSGQDKQWTKLPFKPVDSGDVSDHPYKTEFDSFFEAISRRKEMPLTGLADAVRTHEVIFAADLSWQQKRPVKLKEIQQKGSQ
jgi:predicted dehydrogenase